MPRDLSLVGASEPIEAWGMTIDTVAVPVAELGRRAVEELVALIAAPNRPRAPVALAMPYLAGDSVAPPPA